MSVLRWIWRVILLLVVGCFVTTIYYMTHNVNMDSALPALNIVGIVGVALLGVIWTAARRYWYVFIMLAALGLLRGLFDDELLTDFQSVWVLVSAGFVVFVLLVVLMTRVLKADRQRHAAAAAHAAAHAAPQSVVAPPVTPAMVATESAPVVTKLVSWPVSVPSAAEAEPASDAAAEAVTEVQAAKEATAKAASATEGPAKS